MQWKSRVAKKVREKPADAVITVGLTAWSEEEEKLKAKRGKRIALRVSVADPYKMIIDKAEKKWKDYVPD